MEAKGRATSRRNFLKLGGISALGALSAGALSACGYQEYTPYADGAVGVAGNGSTTANGLPSFMQAPEPIAKVAETVDCDVLVIGAGAAGTPAALSAVENGAKVVGGNNWGNVDLVTTMCEGSSAAIDWLAAHGLVLDNITTTGGMSVQRCHRPTDGSAIGASYVPAMTTAVEDAGIEVVYNVRATELVQDETGAVCGVACEDGSTYGAKAVILCSGGFGSNPDMITEYRPDLATFVSTNAPSITGDGMVMAQKAGANLIQMSQIQIHPTVYADGSLIAEGVRGGGAILVNNAGERFINEMDTRDVVSAAELEQDSGQIWVVYDQTVYDNNGACAGYENREMSIKADDLAGLADALGIPADALQATVDTYNQSVGGAEDPFGRTTGFVEPLETAPFYAIPVYPGIHHCMGGVRINTDNQAMDIMGNTIPGLYAAGEVTGGIHGANRIGGNAICDITVMGINAGQKAAAAIA